VRQTVAILGTSVDRLIALALEEDLGCGDITSEGCLSGSQEGRGLFRAKSDLICAGLFLLPKIYGLIETKVTVLFSSNEGEVVSKGKILAEAVGPLPALLAGERTCLNFLQQTSGVATLTRKYVDAVAGFECRIVDTRKTIPGWRALQKYAVRTGGGQNHRFGLFDGVLIKDNHIRACGDLKNAVHEARRRAHFAIKIEVECENLDQVAQALEAGVDIIMLDNMNIARMKEAVRLVAGRVLVEASGGINLETVRDIAATGVDLISVGALTHSPPAVDINMKLA
jgi:nicotinate-nucleotide pyrophosphorylase (carboxylating)